MPIAPVVYRGSLHCAGSSADTSVWPRPKSLMLVVTNQYLPSWCRSVDPNTPPESRPSPTGNCERRVRMLPTCCHDDRSVERHSGAPGEYSKLELAR